MKWQILIDGELREEIDVAPTMFSLRLPKDGISISYSQAQGLRVTCEQRDNRMEVRMVESSKINGHQQPEYVTKEEFEMSV